jgi:phytoene dehydrogenase-like protein
MRDIVIIGSGHNALVAAFYLAKSGLKPLVLERRDTVGGAAITSEFHPGFRCSTLAHATGPLRPQVLRDMQLERHGLELLRPDPRVFAPSPDGRAVALYDDPARSAAALARHSERDSKRLPEFHAAIAALGAVFAELMPITPPSVDDPSPGDLWTLAKLGRQFRALGRANEFRLLRYVPMAAADLVAEWFETDLLRATVAARGIFGTFFGPWSAGSGAMLLVCAGVEGHSAGSATFVKGGLGRLTQAMAAAARDAGAEIRTAAEVDEIDVSSGKATGVRLTSGEQIAARAVVSGADPRRTFLGLVNPAELDPDFLLKMRNYRSVGTMAKLNLALSGLPAFTAATDPAMLRGRIHIGPGIDYLERAFDAAKYGDFSREPYLDVTIPTLTDPDLAPPGRHVMSICMQYAPYALRGRTWTDARDELARTVVRTLAQYAPALPDLIEGHQVITPADLEAQYALTGGHIYHGEMAIDQLFAMRPVLGWAQYRTPVQGLYLCGAGTHPGGGMTGAPGANAAREIARDLKNARSAAG